MSASQTQSMSSTSSSIWLLSRRKLKFFARIRRFLQSKSARKRCVSSSSDHSNKLLVKSNTDEEGDRVVIEKTESELDGSMALQTWVKRLHFGSWEEKEMAAKAIGKLAKEDVKERKLMAELGVINMLVSMVATEVAGRRLAAVKALIELADGTFTNKALMLEAAILSKLPKDIDVVDNQTRHEFAELLLSLSSISITHFSLAKTEVIQFLVGILESASGIQTKEICLGVVCNLSVVLENAGPLVSNGIVDTVLKLSSFKELSEKALAALSHLVLTMMGKKAMEDSSMVPESLIEILTWEDKQKCQELSAYILMILAHQSSTQRDKMSKAGIVPVLLEVSLLGSPLAQKRAMKLLQWFKDERQAKMGPHSGPQTGRVAMGSPLHPREAQEGKTMMKNLVKQSLHKNMEMITRRANAAGDSSNLKSLVLSTSSKSLPY
ncbi:putative DNA binding protein [Hibiscus syriacus]|uniref:DNA binding protein n=1 Tax=Hibiscus syriacus TaxID=106335 RepID=A0A6A3AXR2_HIBSY|nr:U-box domain-containing protein 7-like [Hibiscus syriacus]KAE8707569.1 putative DNA binding protein [Hibiscus syriacus]